MAGETQITMPMAPGVHVDVRAVNARGLRTCKY